MSHVENRDQLIKAMLEELVGPASAGTELDCSGRVSIAERAASYGPFRESGTGEEVLTRDTPTRRYGVAVLYPLGSDILTANEDQIELPGVANGADLPVSDSAREELTEIMERASRKGDARDNSSEFDLSASSGFRPSSMAVSFLVAMSPGDRLRLRATGGVYRSIKAEIEGKERVWWVRRPVCVEGEVDGSEIVGGDARKLPPMALSDALLPDLKVQFEVYCRPRENASEGLVTICLINRSSASGAVDPLCVFQAEFKVVLETEDGRSTILPYPAPPISRLDDEEQGLELLFRSKRTYAVGHGCSADWSFSGDSTCREVRATAVPMHETPSMTPDVITSEGERLEIPMALLASEEKWDDAIAALERVAREYRAWVNTRKSEIPKLEAVYRPAAERHLKRCGECATRIEDGIRFLLTDSRAPMAFRLANASVLFQQLNSGREARRIIPGGRRQFSETFVAPDLEQDRAQLPKWRAFQIAFLLMSLRSAVDATDDDRETVELIWFPTGGGKTEAYLGLAAFAAFYRRLSDPQDDGVHILMRYTLRLLTAQQFQRAARLICAMEFLRRANEALLGPSSFSIGIWLGGETTPNRRADAVAMLRKLLKGDKYADNGFLLDRCPWCRAEIGVIRTPGGQTKVIGYEQRGSTVAFCCSDPSCEFEEDLPIYVIDEDIYDNRPTLLIGTVDKFASLAWKPEARAIFGLDAAGDRISSPPSVIVQDELHLIAGPLGSVVGLYEVLIEELCTDRRGTPIKPKIVCSTATIRRYQDQVLALYGRSQVQLFPPPGLDASDSFFARYATRDDGGLERGRLYLGVYGPGLGSIQTAQVRTFASVLAGSFPFSDVDRDPWWTLLVFFNSLRELGGTVSLLQSDIPDYLRTIRNRTGAKETRYLNNVLELTSRLTKDEIPQALRSLETTTNGSDKFPVDVCLASSIIEVGVDIDRLSLMAIVGQPKTTSQYIQVSGRVGRQWKDRPGLVISIYGVTKARDRSHFERFRSYHERLYAQVEPTSVTPFSRPVVERALHAVMSGFVRQTGSSSQANSPEPCPKWLLDRLEKLLANRVKLIDDSELAQVNATFQRRLEEWVRWGSRIWSSYSDEGEIPLLRPAGAYAPADWVGKSWATPQSMRNVDAECQAEITTLYS